MTAEITVEAADALARAKHALSSSEDDKNVEDEDEFELSKDDDEARDDGIEGRDEERDNDNDDHGNDDDDDDDEEEQDDKEEDEEDNLARFRSIISEIDLIKLSQLAVLLRVHQKQMQGQQPDNLKDLLAISCSITDTMHGAFNLPFEITFSDGVKWIARVPANGTNFGPLDAKKMDTEYHTMRHIKANTSIPLPEIFYWETSTNHIGFPFALMSYMEGRVLGDAWHSGHLSESDRLDILSSLAEYVAQFQKMPFDRSGTLEFDENGDVTGIGETVVMEESATGSHWEATRKIGPFTSTKEAFESMMTEDGAEEMDVSQRANLSILHLILHSVPDYLLNEEKFYLSVPDFGYQNILVDSQNRITGFVDWDEAQTEDSCSGYASYPIWLCDDWDPALYAYHADPKEGTFSFGDSPETLLAYRQHYAAEFAKHACTADGYDPRMKTLSHILDALTTAISVEFPRSLITAKLLDHAFGGNVPFEIPEYADDYVAGDTSEKDALIKKAVATMWHPEWEKAQDDANDEAPEDHDSTAVLVHMIDTDGKETVDFPTINGRQSPTTTISSESTSSCSEPASSLVSPASTNTTFSEESTLLPRDDARAHCVNEVEAMNAERPNEEARQPRPTVEPQTPRKEKKHTRKRSNLDIHSPEVLSMFYGRWL